QHALESYLRQVEESVESAIGASAGRGERQAIAEKLLEPDFQKLPDLAVHAREVANVAQRFARYLELPAHQIETIRIAALVHDVGMRLIDYDRLYRKEELTAEEKRAVAEHPVVGAALVEPLLGAEVAYAVLRHHERFDGKGYPSKIGGQQIPLAARIIQIADTWTTMTSSHTYKKEPAREEEAIEQLRDAAGTQLDSTLTIKFIAALPQIVNR
ncbi:MAG TPA: HD domain-containing phosphohydrolase, partial [Thermoanaerobaculia bacterium]